MTITLSEQAYTDLWQAVEATAQADPLDPLDVTYDYPTELGQGWIRWIQLREGLEMEIFNAQLSARQIVIWSDQPSWVCYHFHLFGHHEDQHTTVGDQEFALYGSGYATQGKTDCPTQRALEVNIALDPKILGSFAGDPAGQLTPELRQLVRPLDQEHYTRVAALTPMMGHVLGQILRCPHRGIQKRMYLEAKSLEVVSLVLEQERAVQLGSLPDQQPLKPGTLERIHHARTLLLQNLVNPPSLMGLAQQVNLNEYTLKRGFRQVFGQPVFEYLHDYRLEQARQLLDTGDFKVMEVAERVGFASRSYFATAFKQRFGLNPKDYQQQKFPLTFKKSSR
ncbi:MAG: AraC family transcriptional regulator [Aphanocapsa sp. GSE-SYN-MK-11-07L]|nr:AraC family transcriptional regulator [Aphanocapsa sp. GSE-SYN-MK-11-07L]